MAQIERESTSPRRTKVTERELGEEKGSGAAVRCRGVSLERAFNDDGRRRSRSGRRRLRRGCKWQRTGVREEDEEPSLLYIEERLVGRKPLGPRRFRCWAATRHQNTRASGDGHIEGHKDLERHIKCARETRDLTTDAAMSVAVRMSLTSAISKLFSTSSRRTYRLKEAGHGLRSSVKRRQAIS